MKKIFYFQGFKKHTVSLLKSSETFVKKIFMEVLAAFETQFKSRPTFDATKANKAMNEFPLISRVDFFQNSTVFPKPIRIEGQAKEMITRLKYLHNLKDNWNGYGAKVPSPVAIKYAIRFIVDNIHYGLPYYFVAPGVNGEVMIELKENDRVAEIYFWDDHSSELLLFKNEEVVLESTLKMDYPKLLQFF